MIEFITVVAVIALVALPFALELYFNAPRTSGSAEEEYVPDGR